MNALIAAAVAALLLLTACGSDDEPTSARDAGGSAEEAGPADAAGDGEVPEVESCEFAPNDDPGAIVAGTATVVGRNTTGAPIDSTSIRFELLDAGGDVIGAERSTNLSFWQPDEEIALEVGIFEETPIETADCRVTDVSPASYAEQEEFDAEAATCEVDPGSPSVQVDLSGVADAPEGEELFVAVGVYEGEVRVGEVFPLHEAGAATATGSTTASGDDLSCRVMQVRTP